MEVGLGKDEEVYGVVYVAENRVNGKKYVGQTTGILKTRIQNHLSRPSNPHLAAAFAKHGYENFKWEILAVARSKEELDQLEVKYIRDLSTTCRYKGYNFRSGGASGKLTDEVKARISASKKGKSLSQEHRTKLSLQKQGSWKGEENPKFGQGAILEGEGNPMFGRQHTVESKQAMKDSLRGRKGFKGSSNPMCGKKPSPRIRVALFKDGELVEEFPAARRAAKFLGISSTYIRQIIKGERKPPLGIEVRCLKNQG